MSWPKFHPDEIKDAVTVPGIFGTTFRKFAGPATPKQNIQLLYEKKMPCWVPGMCGENNFIRPVCMPDIASRAPEGGRDMFGIEWTYVPVVKGSIVKPGSPTVPDINEWEKYVNEVDVYSWDWAGCAEKMKAKLDPTRMSMGNITCGFFERLISFLDFEDAAVALVDEEQQEGVHRLFNRLCEIYDDEIACLKKYFDIGSLNFHDDWGSQRAPFFKTETVREMILPYIKRVVESCHKRGIFFDFHSCGFVEPLVPIMIEAGMDSWGGQELNDKMKLKSMYGDKLIWTIPAPVLDADATDEEVKVAAEKFFNEVAKDGGVIIQGASHPKFIEYLYEISRNGYAGN